MQNDSRDDVFGCLQIIRHTALGIFNGDRVADSKLCVLINSLLEHAFIRAFREPSLKYLNRVYPLRERYDHNVSGVAAVRDFRGGPVNAFDIRDTLDRAYHRDVIFSKKLRGYNLNVPKVCRLKELIGIVTYRTGSEIDSQISIHREHGNNNDGQIGNYLLHDVSYCILSLCMLHGNYQMSSSAWTGWRFFLIDAILPFLSLTTRSAIFAISPLWVTIMTVVPLFFTMSSMTLKTSMLVA